MKNAKKVKVDVENQDWDIKGYNSFTSLELN